MSEQLLEAVRPDFQETRAKFADNFEALENLTEAQHRLVKHTAEIFYTFGRSDSLSVAAGRLTLLGTECHHPNYRITPHPDGGEQPWCPKCQEFVEL